MLFDSGVLFNAVALYEGPYSTGLSNPAFRRYFSMHPPSRRNEQFHPDPAGLNAGCSTSPPYLN